jgi:hypothetical protein
VGWKSKRTGDIAAFGAELNQDCQTNDSTDQRAVMVYISTCSLRHELGIGKRQTYMTQRKEVKNTPTFWFKGKSSLRISLKGNSKMSKSVITLGICMP